MTLYTVVKVAVFSILLTYVLSTQCSKRSQCDGESTCCRISKGYGCCGGVNAVCCSDGKTCCPSETTCDLKRGKCVPKKIPNVGFLVDENNLPSVSQMMNSTSNITFNDTFQMIDGFFFALNISRYIKSYDACKVKNFNLGSHLIDLIYSIKDFNQFPDVATALQIIFNDFGDVFVDLYDNYKSCLNYTQEFPVLFDVLVKYFSNENYFRSFYDNIIKQVNTLMGIWAKVKYEFDEKLYFQAGKDFGQLFSLVIFPEIEQTTQPLTKVVLRENTSLEPVTQSDASKTIKCIVETCLSYSQEIINLVKNFKIDEAMNLFFKLKNNFTSCINKI